MIEIIKWKESSMGSSNMAKEIETPNWVHINGELDGKHIHIHVLKEGVINYGENVSNKNLDTIVEYMKLLVSGEVEKMVTQK